MKFRSVIVFLAVLLMFAACKDNGNHYDDELYDVLLQQAKVETPVNVSITGKVNCSICASNDQMMIYVLNDGDEILETWGPSSIGTGEFAMESYGMPGGFITLSVSVGISPAKTHEKKLEIPADVDGDRYVVSDFEINID